MASFAQPMKYLGLLLLACSGGILLWIALVVGAPTYLAPRTAETVPVVLTGEVPNGFIVRRLSIDGMCCQGCAAKLHALLIQVEGVREVAVDALTGEASVVVPAGTEVALLEQAVTFEDYTAEAQN
jgi:copper chaperone CopZ